MMRNLETLLTILLLLLVAGCGSSRLQIKLPDTSIPSEAETALFISDLSADKLFETVKDSLKHNGYLIDQSNKTLYAISTRSRNMGKSKQMRMSFLIEPLDNDNARMTVRAEWRSIPDPARQSEDVDAEDVGKIGWQAAKWADPIASKRAFGYLVKFIHTIPHENITYN